MSDLVGKQIVGFPMQKESNYSIQIPVWEQLSRNNSELWKVVPGLTAVVHSNVCCLWITSVITFF